MDTPLLIEKGDIVKITCDTGYTLNQSAATICVSSGSWNHYPTCRPLDCGDIQLTDFLSIDNKTNLEVCFGCADEYKMNGRECSTCQDNEIWTTFPSCIELNCPNFTISKGTVDRNKYEANITCDLGYELSNNGPIRCNLDMEEWSSFPKCLPVDCGDAILPEFGNISYTDGSTTFGSTIALDCYKGYVPTYVHNSSCLYTGKCCCPFQHTSSKRTNY